MQYVTVAYSELKRLIEQEVRLKDRVAALEDELHEKNKKLKAYEWRDRVDK